MKNRPQISVLGIVTLCFVLLGGVWAMAVDSPAAATTRFTDVAPGEKAVPLQPVATIAPKAPTVPSSPLAPEIPSPSAPVSPSLQPANTSSLPAQSGNTVTDPIAAALRQAEEAGLAPVGGADMNGGYAGQVLQQLLPHWQPPSGISGVVTVSLRIGNTGRPLYCEPVKRSGNVELDESPCEAALRVGTFGNPPYGAVTEVFLTLATDKSALIPVASKNPTAQAPGYAEAIMNRVKPVVQVPKGLTGSHTVVLSLQVNTTGGVEQISVTRSSGRADVDNAVLAALCTPGIIPPFTGEPATRNLRLLFTIKGN